MAVKIQKRHGTAAEWTTANPILLVGEPGYETDTGKEKTGDGVTDWNTLPYSGGAGATFATQPEVDAGVVANKAVAPDTYQQGITNRLATLLEAQEGTDATKLMTPALVAAAIQALITAGSNITITPSGAGIQIASTGGGGSAYPDNVLLVTSPGTVNLTAGDQGIISALVPGVTFELPSAPADGETYKFIGGGVEYTVNAPTGILTLGGTSFEISSGRSVTVASFTIMPSPGLVWAALTPTGGSVWTATARYTIGEFVTYSGVVYISKTAFNINNQPDTSPAQWFPLAAAGGEVNDGANVGGGTGVYQGKSGVTLNFKTLVAGANVTITEPTADTIAIAAASGEVQASGSGSIPEANITWVGGTAPTGFTSATYSWRRLGNIVMLRVALSYSSSGSGNTGLNVDFTGITLPSSQGAYQPGSAAIIHDTSPFIEAAPAARDISSEILRTKFSALNANTAEFNVVWEWNG